MRQILIKAGKVTIRARLLSTPTADRIWDSLPMHGAVQTWGREVYFRTSISPDLEPDARAVVSKGEIAFWPDGDAITIGFGATPISKRGEIRFTSKCNVWAIAIDDVDQLKGVYAGEDITVMEAELGEAGWQGRASAPPLHRAGRHSRLHAGACPVDDANG
jgi:hypothetical protein